MCETWVLTVGSARTKPFRDLAVRQAAGNELQDFELPVGELRVARRSAGRRGQPVAEPVEQLAGDRRRQQRVAGGDRPDRCPEIVRRTSLRTDPLAPARSASTTYSSASKMW